MKSLLLVLPMAVPDVRSPATVGSCETVGRSFVLRALRILIAALLLWTPVAAQEYLGPPRPDSSTSEKKSSSYPSVEAAVSAAQAQLAAGIAALDRQDKATAKKSLDQARGAFEKALKTNPTSRAAAEGLGMAYYYRGVVRGKSELEDAAKFLAKVVEVDPEAFQAIRFLAHCSARLGRARETISYAGQALALSTDTATTRELTALQQQYQEDFLADWYEYGKYYDSPGAKLTRVNLQTYQLELVLQITPQFEQELAARGLQQLAPQLQPHQDAVLQAYLQRLVDKLAAKSPNGPPFTYAVDVVESPQVNAFAFPGKILVNTGLIRFTDSEAELVAVLSHELAHIYAHHSARALVASYQKRMIAGPLLAAAGVDNSNLKEILITLGVGLGLEILDRGYSRGEEKEADKLGTHIAYNAGYNPTFMTSFFLRLYQANPKQPFKLLATHPPTPERIQYTTAYLEAFPLGQEMQIDSQEFKEMKSRIK